MRRFFRDAARWGVIYKMTGIYAINSEVSPCPARGTDGCGVPVFIPSGRGNYDGLESIDVSECPALKELNCDRDSDLLKTLYLKEGQAIPELTKRESTAIVYK